MTGVYLFNADDMIASMRAEARGAIINGVMVPTLWEGHWSKYALRDGMRVPFDGEVAWMLPVGTRPYWDMVVRHGGSFSK